MYLKTELDLDRISAPAPERPDPVVEVLQEAKALLVEKGWIKGHFNEYGYCSIGAINHAASHHHLNDSQELDRTFTKALGHLQRVIGTVAVGLWNDGPHITKSDVLTAFDRAIERARSKHATV